MQQCHIDDGLDFLLLVPLGLSLCCPYPEPCAPGRWGSQRKGVFQTNHLGDAGVSIDLMNIFFFTMFIH